MTDNNTCYRFKPGDIAKMRRFNIDDINSNYVLLRSTHLDDNECRVTTSLKVPRGAPVFIVDYFNKENPGLHVKWYVMYQEKIWWVYESELETTT
jgi:hypothetical protein